MSEYLVALAIIIGIQALLTLGLTLHYGVQMTHALRAYEVEVAWAS